MSPGNLRDVGGGSGAGGAARRERRRDPSGKAALFSPPVPPVAREEPAPVAPAPPPLPSRASEPRRPATVVVECSTCDERTRVSYVDFMLLNLPLGVWLPLPGLQFNRRMTCPACGEWTWLQAHWFE